MIRIKKSSTADTRTCDYTKVSKEELLEASNQHRDDVAQGFEFFVNMMMDQSWNHDWDKLDDIDGFHKCFKTGFTDTTWWDNHRKVNRHHLGMEDGVPDDVNLIDVLDMVIDCVMAGMGRAGEVRELDIDPDVLMKAFQNTAVLLASKVEVQDK